MPDRIEALVYDDDTGETHKYDEYVLAVTDDDVAILVGKGLAFENSWTPGSVLLTVIREYTVNIAGQETKKRRLLFRDKQP